MTPEIYFAIKTFLKNRQLCNGFENSMEREDEYFDIHQTFKFYGKYWEEISLHYCVARTPEAKTFARIQLTTKHNDSQGWSHENYQITDLQHKTLTDMMHKLWSK
jgi:hypothetical protein